mgnify:CR=1 FL=1
MLSQNWDKYGIEPIAQKRGADALSFRLLAERLKVTPMAVAYHSGSKHALLADLVGLAPSKPPCSGREKVNISCGVYLHI